jgi:hypothetical protein
VPATLGVTSFVDADSTGSASDFTATINWGDGTSTSGVQATGSGGIYTLQAVTHTYAGDSVSQSGGVYTVTVTITDDGGSTLATSGTVAVVRPPLTLFVGDKAAAPGSLSLSNDEVAAFTVPDTSDTSSEFAATINWGDGTTSSGTVTGGGGLFHVLGSHTYAEEGEYLLQVAVSQHWDTLLTAAQRPTRRRFPGQGSQIFGPHVVLGVSQTQFDRDPRTLPGFGFGVFVKDPEKLIDPYSIKWSVDPANLGKVVLDRDSVEYIGVSWKVDARATFLSTTPRRVYLEVSYKIWGEGPTVAPHWVTPYPVSLVELSLAFDPVLQKNPRWASVAGTIRGQSTVFINTQPDRRYSYEGLKDPNPAKLADQLDLGIVSFKASVILRGAGPDKLEGVSKIGLGWLQDIQATTVKVFYTSGSGSFQPNSRPPWLDSNRELRTGVSPGNGADSSFTRSSTQQDPYGNGHRDGESRIVVSLDAPREGFPEWNNGALWTRTEGALTFVNHLTAYSKDDDKIYVVLGRVQWALHLVGQRDPATGDWVKDDTKAKVDLPQDMDLTGGPGVGALPAYGAQVPSFNPNPPTFFTATNGNQLTFQD